MRSLEPVASETQYRALNSPATLELLLDRIAVQIAIFDPLLLRRREFLDGDLLIFALVVGSLLSPRSQRIHQACVERIEAFISLPILLSAARIEFNLRDGFIARVGSLLLRLCFRAPENHKS